MTHAGCLFSLALFGVLFWSGIALSVRKGHGVWPGALLGLAGWVTLLTGYAAALSAYALTWERRRRPGLIGIPAWGHAAVWGVFLGMGWLTWWLAGRL